MRKILFILLILSMQSNMFGQDRSDGKNLEIGVNMTSLVSQLLPFQQSTSFTGPYHLQIKSGRNNHLFSFKIGAHLTDFFDAGDNFFNLSFGYNRRKLLSEKWDMNIGYNLMIIGGSFNDPVNTTRDIGGLGFGLDFGFQYHLNSRISLGTETTLFVGPTTEILAITFVPPVGIFLIGRLK